MLLMSMALLWYLQECVTSDIKFFILLFILLFYRHKKSDRAVAHGRFRTSVPSHFVIRLTKNPIQKILYYKTPACGHSVDPALHNRSVLRRP